jgi:lipopolysaccharide export system permease protein
VKLIERYILRRIVSFFLGALGTMTGLVWVTQALRELDLITAKGQAIVAFVTLTMLFIPFVVMVIAPIVLIIAIIQVLNGLNADNELVVINAGGASRIVVLKPVMVASVAVALFVLFLGTTLSPMALRELREASTRINVDLLTTVIQPGRFIDAQPGLTFHIKARAADGGISSLMVDDRRDKVTQFIYIAREAQVAEAFGRQLLVMKNGTIQRRTMATDELAIVAFDAYAFDMTDLQPSGAAPVFRPSERYITELLVWDMNDHFVKRYPGRLRAELHDRLSQVLFPIAYGFVLFAFLGDPRTTRQNRGLSIAGAVVACAVLRLSHFGAAGLAGVSDVGYVVMYLIPIVASAIAGYLILTGKRLSLPAPVAWLVDWVAQAISSGLETVRARLAGLFKQRVTP